MEHQPFWWKKTRKDGDFPWRFVKLPEGIYIYMCLLHIVNGLTRMSPKTQFVCECAYYLVPAQKLFPTCIQTKSLALRVHPTLMLVHLPRAGISISNPLWGISTLLCSYCMQLHQIFWSNFCWSFSPHTPRSGSLQQLALTSKKIQFHSGATIIVRPGKTGMEDENMISGDFFKEGHGHGRELCYLC